jgi:hypothetical protein
MILAVRCGAFAGRLDSITTLAKINILRCDAQGQLADGIPPRPAARPPGRPAAESAVGSDFRNDLKRIKSRFPSIYIRS